MDLGAINLTREELYEKVWTAPITEIAKTHSVRDHDIIKLCEKNNIPRPPSGYWSRLRHGYHLDRPPLPTNSVPNAVKKNRHWEQKTPLTKKPVTPAHPKFDSQVNEQIEIISPHPLITKTYKAYKSIHPDKSDRLRSEEEALNVWVGYRSLDRTLYFVDLLIKELESRAYTVSIERKTFDDGWTTLARIDSEKLPFHVEESSERKPLPASDSGLRSRNHSYEYVANGTLSLVIDHFLGESRQKSWADTKTRKLEERIPEIIDGMIEAAAKLKVIRIEDEKRHEQIRIEEERRRKIEEEEKFRKEQIAQLEPCSLSWEKAARIRKFALAIEAAATKKFGKIEPGSPVASFVELAISHADSIDPVIQTLKTLDRNQQA
ncbi:hypothetical protein K2X30_10170 [bacterium]|nr:hypothetical protein [bacterium]